MQEQVIFLDFDGVLRSKPRRGAAREWNDQAIRNFKELLRVFPAAKVVVVSAWRVSRSDDELRELLGRMAIDPSRYLGKTPVMAGAKRADEIKAWLENCGSVAWVVLDDNDLGPGIRKKQVRPDYRFGLRFLDCKVAARVLENAEQ